MSSDAFHRRFRDASITLWRCTLILILPLVALVGPFHSKLPVAATHPPPTYSLGPPGMFVENVGQFPERVRFAASLGSGQTLWVTDAALWLTLRQTPRETVRPAGAFAPRTADAPFAGLLPPSLDQGGTAMATQPGTDQVVALRISFPGAAPSLVPEGRLAASVSYFMGQVPKDWRTGVPAWRRVRLAGVAPGVDLCLGSGGLWQFVASGIESNAVLAGQVRMRIEGADAVSADGETLRLQAAVGVWQVPLSGVAAADVRSERGSVFEVAARAGPAAEIPDTDTGASATPGRQADRIWRTSQAGSALELVYGTYLGGSSYGYEAGRDIATDAAGNLYVVGSTASPDFPTTPGVVGGFYNGGDYDVFVAKLNATGTDLIFATFIGGVGDDWGRDYGYGVDVDASGVYVAGWTDSRTFPATPGAYDRTYNGGYYDAFAAKLNPTGTALLYATYLGGSDEERGIDIAVDGAGSATVVGWTASSDFPNVGAESGYDAFRGGDADAFAVKLNAGGTALDHAIYIGGSGLDVGTSLAMNGADYAYVTGWTESSDFPWRLAVDSLLSGQADAFLSVVRPNSGSLLSSTYLGGSQNEIGYDVAVDAEGRAYVVGTTNSTDFPVTDGAYDTDFNGGYKDGFVSKLYAGTMYYATYLGDSDDQDLYGVAVDGNGSAYITGDYGGNAVTVLAPGGGAVDTGYTANLEWGEDIAVDAYGGVYLLGYANHRALPVTPGAFDPVANSVWLAKLARTTEISGRVTDASGAPLAGIPVSADGLYSTTTDLSGDYTIQVPAGQHTFAPMSAGYLWDPELRTVGVPPAVGGQDFVGRTVRKAATPGAMAEVDFGDVLTYTLALVASEARTVVVYDSVPPYTAYVAGSLVGPVGLAYDPGGNAITGTLSLAAETPVTVMFGARVVVTGTAASAPEIHNKACVHPPGEGLDACEWSNETINYTFRPLVFLPLVMR